jgi:hypothetical protein
MVKIDDKSGFHHLNLDPHSRDLACCEYGGKIFRYNAAAFGIPKVQRIYQSMNMGPVIRKHNFNCFLYLDDRIFLINPESKSEEQALRRGEKVPMGPFLGLLLMSAAETYINRAKSV